MHPSQVTDWRRQLLERAADVFGGVAAPSEPAVDIKALHAKTGQLTLEKDFQDVALDLHPGELSLERLALGLAVALERLARGWLVATLPVLSTQRFRTLRPMRRRVDTPSSVLPGWSRRVKMMRVGFR